jgi:hypothetical protein
VIRADLNDEESLKTALTNVNIVYLVTDFWTDPSNPGIEKEQALRVVKLLAESSTLETLIWSSLPSVSKASGGKYKAVIHFDGKAEVAEAIEREYKDLWAKTIVLLLPTYYQAWLQFPQLFAPRKTLIEGNEVYVHMVAAKESTTLPLFDVTETGSVVDTILARSNVLGGRTVSAIGQDDRSLGENLAVWGKVVGKHTKYHQLSQEESIQGLTMAGLPDTLVKDLAEMPVAFGEHEDLYRGDGVVLVNDVRRIRALPILVSY